MKGLKKLDNIVNPEVLENITNWSEIKNYVKISSKKSEDRKIKILLSFWRW